MGIRFGVTRHERRCMRLALIVVVSGMMALLAPSAHATIMSYTSRAAFDAAVPGFVYEDFSSVTPVLPETTHDYTSPVVIGNATYSSTAPDANHLTAAAPGVFGNPNTVLGGWANALGQTLVVNFASPVSAWAIGVYSLIADQDNPLLADVRITVDGTDITTLTSLPFGGAPSFIGLVGTAGMTFSEIRFTPVTTCRATFDPCQLVALTDARVPEPGTVLLFGAGLLGLGAFARRRPARPA